jgi:hypothetical protein
MISLTAVEEKLVQGWTEFVPVRRTAKSCFYPLTTPALHTREQHRQASSAIFDDSDLPFTLTQSEPAFLSLAAEGADDETIDCPRVRRAPTLKVSGLLYVGGVDISFREGDSQRPGGEEDAVAVLAVLSWPDLKVRLLFSFVYLTIKHHLR